MSHKSDQLTKPIGSHIKDFGFYTNTNGFGENRAEFEQNKKMGIAGGKRAWDLKQSDENGPISENDIRMGFAGDEVSPDSALFSLRHTVIF